jgi:hypothetical protein
MDYVTQANSLAKDKKSKARQLFKESFLEVAHKGYAPLHHDALIDLSALFGVKWFAEFKNSEFESANATLYAEANTAFNYANLDSIVRGNIMAVLKHRIDDNNRISEEKINDIRKQLCFLLTNTTVSAVRENLGIY